MTAPDFPFGSHMAALAAAVLQARPGPVLEYGVGHYSTPLLHFLCEETGRHLVSLESDPEWAARFNSMRTAQHTIEVVSSWSATDPLVERNKWSVVLIDHAPEERRAQDIRRVRDLAEFVVVHDWPQPGERCYAHRWVSRTVPTTAVLSNVRAFRMGGRQ